MTLSAEARKFYAQLDGAVAVCRGKRRHNFPGLVPGKTSRYVDVQRISGVYEVTETCQNDCGRTITYTAGRDGRPDYSTARYGGWKIGVQLAPRNSGITREDDYAEMIEVQKTVVKETYAAQRLQDAGRRERIDAERQRQGPPAARFRQADPAKVG
jgi:hypothetical protein